MANQPAAQITLNVSSITRGLAIATGLLVAASVAVLLWCELAYGASPHEVRWAQFFYLDGERNVPTAFSVFLLLSAATLLTVISVLERHRPGFAVYWVVLATGFVCMAIDEAWSFHEKMTAVMRPLLGGHGVGIWYYAWVVPALIFVALMGLFFLRFLLRLPAPTRLAFIVAGFVYLAGAVGIELIEGVVDEVSGDRNLVSGLIEAVQETMEMAGIVLFIRSLLLYFARTHDAVRLAIQGHAAHVDSPSFYGVRLDDGLPEGVARPLGSESHA